MFISCKPSTKIIIWVDERDWACRKRAKELSTPDYWAWLETIKDSDGVPDYSGETGYSIVECTDEDVNARLDELSDYIEHLYFLTSESPAGKKSKTGVPKIYNIKYYASKRNAEEIKDIDGNSHDPKQYVSSHFVGQDDTKDARILAEKWANVRAERDRKIAATDWRVIVASESDEGSDLPTKWKTYRTNLRDITEQADPDNITWPTEPS